MSYYLSPRFLDKLAVHITKNYLDLAGVKVPLILGVHGRKGEGKSFQCDLVFERMGVGVVHMSAGELESPDAGDPARLIRLRYREAADWVKVNGKMAVLMINDIDAGMGRIDQFTQYTVNTQLVAGTLMNIADKPTDVQLPGSYDAEPIQRIPIVVTGNDFATLYAPLVRDGRMEKFYWEPNRADRIGIVRGIFERDSVSSSDIENLVDTFPTQSIDFYSALHSRLYDEQVRQFIQEIGIDRVSSRVVNSAEKLPDFRQPNFSLSHLIELGQLMVEEQQRLQELRLVSVYNNLQSNPASQSHSPTQTHQPQHSAVSSLQPSPTPSHSGNGMAAQGNGATHRAVTPRSTDLADDTLRTLQNILDGGQRLGIELVDARRFRTNSWQSYSMIQPSANALTEAQAALSACLAEHPQDYIRLVAINPTDRRRTSEIIVHRP
ncbi:MAG: AAA family ATPase [Cyanobacteria bacterium RM1_2_2]|nr:AAA family ATPase [Cyanobacteria bacterium RM1_2_2]